MKKNKKKVEYNKNINTALNDGLFKIIDIT